MKEINYNVRSGSLCIAGHQYEHNKSRIVFSGFAAEDKTNEFYLKFEGLTEDTKYLVPMLDFTIDVTNGMTQVAGEFPCQIEERKSDGSLVAESRVFLMKILPSIKADREYEVTDDRLESVWTKYNEMYHIIAKTNADALDNENKRSEQWERLKNSVREFSQATAEELSEEVNEIVTDLEYKRDHGFFKGEKGDKGEKGADGKMTFEDLTPEQKASLKGDPFRYEDFTPSQLESLKVKGDKGDKGEDGYTPIKGIDYFDGEKGDKGDQGDKGTSGARGKSILSITTAPSSYTTQTGGFTPSYRIKISTASNEASSSISVGDELRQSYYLYPVGYIDSSYAYLGARVSIRGVAGSKGDTGPEGPAGADGDITEQEEAELLDRLDAFSPISIQQEVESFISDYVVESGTSGSITYQKYASGKCIAWYYGSYDGVVFNTADGSVYWTGTSWEIPLPNGLFNARPVTTANVLCSYGVWATVRSTSTKDKIELLLISSASRTTNVTVYAHMFGTWR